MTGIPPLALLEEDADMFEELERAVIRRETSWSTSAELQASTLEMLHSLYLLTARANGAKNVGKPLHVPRPGEETIKPKMMSPREFAAQMRRTGG